MMSFKDKLIIKVQYN